MFASKDLFLTRPSGYTISRSVRLRSSASAYFNRTPASAGNRKTWTWSGWVKRGTLGTRNILIQAEAGGNTNAVVEINASDQLRFFQQVGGVDNFQLVTTQVFRDPSAWYHLVIQLDTTQATSTNRAKLYVNGSQITALATAVYPAQNFDGSFNNNVAQYIGTWLGVPAYFDGYLTEINFIDGQALTPSSFGSTNAVTGVWQPIKYTGTYGTNGFYLNFSDNSAATATTIGKDYSGNGNNWTPNNISVTAGATYDSMLDVPTLYADGGNGRGNYCVLNPLDKDANLTFSDANLTSTGYNAGGAASFALTSGKWYWEVTLADAYASNNWGIHGISSGKSNSYVSGYTGYPTGAGVWAQTSANGGTWASGSAVTASTTWANGDVIGFAFDATNLTLDVYRNNTKIGTTLTVPSGAIYPSAYQNGTSGDTSSTNYNFGQRPFTYTPPTGFVALNTQNLPTPTISNGANYMAATLYTGTNATLSITNTVNGVSSKPDFLWVKRRDAAGSHLLWDSVRGVTLALNSDRTAAEQTATGGTGLTSFNSNGFTLGGDFSGTGSSNTVSATYVAWQWQASGSTVSNTSGSITSTVSAGATQGFSVATFTAQSSGTGTFGHGLGVAPSMVIVKQRASVGSWGVYHVSVGNGSRLLLDSTAASVVASSYWNNTSPTSTVVTIGTGWATAGTMVAYCFAAVAGYSAFGSYTGNGSTDGTFVYTGFRPRWIMIKRTDLVANWTIIDTSMSPYNVTDAGLLANSSGAQSTGAGVGAGYDILSNGFKARLVVPNEENVNGATMIYAAFAENPFKLSLAR